MNGLFRKLLNLASEKVFSELVGTKCIPILLYGLECFQLGKADRHFTVNRLCMKLFKTGSTHAAEDCQSYFAIGLTNCVLETRMLVLVFFVLLPTSAANLPVATAAVDRWDRQTDTGPLSFTAYFADRAMTRILTATDNP